MPKFAAKAAKKAETKAKAMEDKKAKWAEQRPVRASTPFPDARRLPLAVQVRPGAGI